MTCHEARELFSARVDEALASDDATQLDAHLAGCAECRAEWARFERTVALVRGIESARAPAGFVNRVLAAADPVPWPLRLARQVFMPLRVKLPLEAAAVVLVAGLAVMTFQHSPEMQRSVRRRPMRRRWRPATRVRLRRWRRLGPRWSRERNSATNPAQTASHVPTLRPHHRRSRRPSRRLPRGRRSHRSLRPRFHPRSCRSRNAMRSQRHDERARPSQQQRRSLPARAPRPMSPRVSPSSIVPTP